MSFVKNFDQNFAESAYRQYLWNGKSWTLAPCYDMLPMALQPVQGEVPAWAWDMDAVQPSAAVLPVWQEARTLARRFWQQVAQMLT